MQNLADIFFPKLKHLASKLHYFIGKEKKHADTKQDKCATSFCVDHNRPFLEILFLHKTNLIVQNNTHLFN